MSSPTSAIKKSGARGAPALPSPESSGGPTTVESPFQLPEDGTDSTNSLTTEIVNQLFSMYCTDFAPQFPFVTFLPTETVSTISINRPLTLQSLIAVALFQSPSAQRKATHDVSQTIKTRMLERSGYSFDLLQAVLIHVAWYQYQFRPKHQEFYLMVQYAITLVHELGIDKSPSEKKKDMTIGALKAPPDEGRRSEQWRALLGTYQQASV